MSSTDSSAIPAGAEQLIWSKFTGFARPDRLHTHMTTLTRTNSVANRSEQADEQCSPAMGVVLARKGAMRTAEARNTTGRRSFARYQYMYIAMRDLINSLRNDWSPRMFVCGYDFHQNTPYKPG